MYGCKDNARFNCLRPYVSLSFAVIFFLCRMMEFL